MKIVLSPAKSLDFKSKLPTTKSSSPIFINEAENINNILKKKSPKKLCDLMGISLKLAELNWKRNQEFKLPFTIENARQAVYAFNGDVYNGLDAYNIPKEKIDSLQDQVRILSGQYGVLKPLDLIQPYRLEMGTKLKIGTHKDLYHFWRKKITTHLNETINNNELFINLASNEYFNAVDEKALKVPVINPIFKDWKNDQLKVISFFAKKARGLMVRYIIDTQAQSVDDIKKFDYDGYQYSESHTQKPSSPVFIR